MELRSITYHSAVIGVYPGAVGVKHANDSYIDLVLPEIIKKEGFSASFSLLIT